MASNTIKEALKTPSLDFSESEAWVLLFSMIQTPAFLSHVRHLSMLQNL